MCDCRHHLAYRGKPLAITACLAYTYSKPGCVTWQNTWGKDKRQ